MEVVGGREQNTIFELADYLGGVAFDANLWPGFCRLLSEYTEDSKIIFQVFDSGNFNCMNLQTYGFMEETIRDYIGHYIHISPWKDAILQSTEGVPIWTDQHVPLREYYKSEFYNDLIYREGGADSATGMNVIKENGRLAVLGVHFDGKKSEALHWRISHLLSSLHKDIKRAININKLRYLHDPQVKETGDFSLSNITMPSFIIDCSGQVISINDRFLNLIESYEFLKIGAFNKLCFADAELQVKFQEKLNGLSKKVRTRADVEYTDLRLTHAGVAFRFSFFPMKQVYNITDFRGIVAHSPSVSLFMVIVGAQQTKDIDVMLLDVLMRKYGLTKTEVKLISYMVEGNTLQEISHLGNTSIHTVRTHLKSVFQKLSIHRQQDLIALVHTLRQQLDE